nr:hypothetical protein [uncultured Marinobacter sp.]
MVNGLVYVTQIGLLALLLILTLRIASLARQASPGADTSPALATGVTSPPARRSRTAAPIAPHDRTHRYTQLHILAALQERDCRVTGLDLTTAPEAVRRYAVAWLFGAGCALSDRPARHTDELAGVVAHIASLKIGVRQSDAIQAIATLTSSSVMLACFRAGLEGAEFWRERHFVPPAHSVYGVITANAFI